MSFLKLVGKSAEILTIRKVVLAGLAAAGIYTVGDDGLSYLKTANRLVSSNVADQIPVEFELERAKTMVGELKPDIKQNLVVIAQEEVRVENIRQDIEDTQASLKDQRQSIVELRRTLDAPSDEVRIGKRAATPDEITAELKRRFENYRLAETTLESKLELLAHRESALEAAREKLTRMLEARRDLEVKIENLEARLRTVQSEAVTSKVDFDESHVAKCESLINSLRTRLQVSERLITQDGKEDFSAATKFTVGSESVTAEIDKYFSSSPSDNAENVFSSLN